MPDGRNTEHAGIAKRGRRKSNWTAQPLRRDALYAIGLLFCPYAAAHVSLGQQSVDRRCAQCLRDCPGPAARRRRRGDGRAPCTSGRSHRRCTGPRLCLVEWILGLGRQPSRMGTRLLVPSTPRAALGRASVGPARRRLALEAGALGARLAAQGYRLSAVAARAWLHGCRAAAARSPRRTIAR
jgi:hypothetical protein